MDTQPAVVLFVPGGGVRKKDSLLGTDTWERCVVAAKLWRELERPERPCYVLVSGGRFLRPAVQTQPIAYLMARALELRGVRRDRILAESGALDTFENVEFGRAVLARHHLGEAEITVVTDRLHGIRVWRTFRAYGDKVKRAVVPHRVSVWWIMRELAFIIYHLCDPVGAGDIAERNRDWRFAAAHSEPKKDKTKAA